MTYEFDKNAFKNWFDFNEMSRNGVIKNLGQRDPNKVSRWLSGQTIGTEDLLKLCNTYNLEIEDFLIATDEEDISKRIYTELPEEIKAKRGKQVNSKQLTEIATKGMKADDITLARLSLKYEQEISELERKHNKEMREAMSRNSHANTDRNKLQSDLQNTINTLTKTIATLQESIEQQQTIIKSQQTTIESLQQIITTMPPKKGFTK